MIERIKRVARNSGESSKTKLQPSGDPSAVAPPVPIPNTEVKRCSPDDSTSIGCAKVGRCQSYAPFLAKAGNGALVFVRITSFCRGSDYSPVGVLPKQAFYAESKGRF